MTTSPTTSQRPGFTRATMHEIRMGLRQAWIESKIQLRGTAILSFLAMPVATFFLVYMFGSKGDAEAIQAAQYVLPSFLAAGVVFGGVVGPASELMMEKTDGYMLRMKVIPGGLRGYVVGKIGSYTFANLAPFILTAVIAAVIMPQYMPDTVSGWVASFGYALLGLLASIPFGVAAGAMIKSAAGLLLPMFISYGLLFVSGIFSPLATSSAWVQVVGQIFPMYWLGLGMRSAFLPPEAASVEIGESWRTLETLGVLGIWIVIGLVVTPILVRRMIRGVSGSEVSAARDRMLARGY